MNCRTIVVACVFTAVMLVAGVPRGGAEMTIAVDLGEFKDAATAAGAHAKVDWLDANSRDDDACTLAFAATELQTYLPKVVGLAQAGKVSIVHAPGLPKPAGGETILLTCMTRRDAGGTKALAERIGVSVKSLRGLGPQSYCIKTVQTPGRDGGRQLCIVGGGRVGALYGAYDLLHRLGVRWLAPEAVHEELPARKLDRLPDFDVVSQPSFLTRGFHSWQKRGGNAFLLWMARNRLNYWCVQEANSPLMRKLGIRMSCGAHMAEKMFLDPHAEYPYNHAKFAGDDPSGKRDKPRDPYAVSKLFQGDANKDGKLSYFEAHPDWYAEVSGKRVPGIRGEFGTNFCTAHPDACREFFKNYVQCLVDGEWREADVVRFWTLDGGKWCQCTACKALGTPTDRNLLLVYQLDKAIKAARKAGRIHRPLIIRFLAYHDVLSPPTRPLPKDFDYETCSATYFPIVRSYVYDFLDPRSPRNARYHKQLLGWAQAPTRHYRGKLCIGEYYNVSGYKGLPICFMHTMARDIPTYYKFGARHFHYMHVVTANMGNRALTNYQMARQLWDVTTDCEALWKDYFATRYGPAAATMRKAYEALERMLCNVTEIKYGLARRLSRGGKGLFSSPQLRFERKAGEACNGPTLVEMLAEAETCEKFMARAQDELQAAGGDQRHRKRLAEDQRLLTYGTRTLAYYEACVRGWRAVSAKDTPGAKKHLAEAERLAALLKKDTTSTQHSSSHANAPNAFSATYATGAIGHLRKAIEAAKSPRN